MDAFVLKCKQTFVNVYVEIVVDTIHDLMKDCKSDNLCDLFKVVYDEHPDRRVHFIIDEFDGECISSEAAKNINGFLQNSAHKHQLENEIVLLPHTMVKDMTYNEVDGEENDVVSRKHDINRFDLMNHFETFVLNESVRNPVAVIEYTNEIRQGVQKSPDKLRHPKSSKKGNYFKAEDEENQSVETKVESEVNLEIDESRNHQNCPELKLDVEIALKDLVSNPFVAAATNEIHVPQTPPMNANNNNFDVLMSNKMDIIGNEQYINNDVLFDESSSNEYIEQENHEVDFDTLTKKLSTFENKSSSKLTKVNYGFSGECYPGHNFLGEKPTFFCLDIQPFNDCDLILCTGLCLEYIKDSSPPLKFSTRIVFMCMNRNTFLMLHNMMLLMDREYVAYTPSFIDAHRDKGYSKSCYTEYKYNAKYLITDFRGFRGLQEDNVFLVLDQTDACWKHYVVECVTRVLNSLTICYISTPGNAQNEERNLLYRLLHNDKVTKIKLTSCRQCFKDGQLFSKNNDIITCHFHVSEAKRKLKKMANFKQPVFEEAVDEDLSSAMERLLITPVIKLNESTHEETYAANKEYTTSRIYHLEPDMVAEFEEDNCFRMKVLNERFDSSLVLDSDGIISAQNNDSINNKYDWPKWFKQYRDISRSAASKTQYRNHMYKTYLDESWAYERKCWSGVPLIDASLVFEWSESQIHNLQQKYDVSLVFDNKSSDLLIYGGLLNRLRLQSYVEWFAFSNTAKVNFTYRNKGRRYMFLVSIQPRQELKLELRKNPDCESCLKFSEIYCSETSVVRDASFKNTPFLKILPGILKEMQHQRSVGVSDVFVHHGKMHQIRPEGFYSSWDIVKKPKVTFTRHEWKSESFEGFKAFRDRLLDNFHFDIRIFTPDPCIILKYKIFVQEVRGVYNFVNCHQVQMPRKRFYDVNIGRGYFCIGDDRVANVDVVDPKTNISSRFLFKIFTPNKDERKSILHHATILKDCLKGIQIVSKKSPELSVPDMPKGYLLVFSRRSQRITYKIASHTLLRYSHESIFVNDGIPLSPALTHNDVFLNTDLMDTGNWKTEDVIPGMEELLNCSEKIKKLMK